MNRIRFLRAGAFALSIAGLSAGSTAAAQAIVAAPNLEADRLAGVMRVLAADPRDLEALITAGRLSARLGDTSAALAFFSRAESISSQDPRIAAGRGAALVRIERPGEALSLFRFAESRGLRAIAYASDRGFAYDLLGQPLLAQRDYQLQLAVERDDETVRRLALSLGITGNVEEAMRELDTLLRKSDRASWRARAFILAMNGDIPGAERIAASMMPGTMGQSLAPFFRRLQGMSPADRAFAVHFGEMSPTQARLADARLAPSLPPYVAPQRPVQLAQVTPPAPVVAQPEKQRDRRSRRERERDERDAAAVPVEAARQHQVATPTPAPLPGPPQYVERAQPIVQPLPTPAPAPIRPTPAPTPPPVRLASSTLFAPPAREAPRPVTPAAVPRTFVAQPAPSIADIRPEPAPVRTLPPEPIREPAPAAPARIGSEDTALAAIVGSITIPAEELAVVAAPPIEPAAPQPEPEPEPAPVRVAPKPVPPKPAAVKPEAKPKPETAKTKAELAKAKPDAKTAKKPDLKKPDPAKTDPPRVWVQVAGGANVPSLPKAWQSISAKATPLKGKAAWWTPLRATNRLLTGPFKTASEAQAFVNTLGKSGVQAFVFTSEAGQKVTKLGN